MVNNKCDKKIILKFLLISISLAEYLIKCSFYDMTYISNQNTTVLNRLQDTCYCDLTKNSCDSYCCCDPDCQRTSLLSLWNTQKLCYSSTNTNLQKYLKFCYTNSSALITDLESPVKSMWRIVKGGFCLFSENFEKMFYSDEINTVVKNITDYDNLILQYVKFQNKSDLSFYSSSDTFLYTIPKLYRNKILPQFLESVSNYYFLISDLQSLYYYVNNINNPTFNWTNPVTNPNKIENLNLGNFTSSEIANVANKLNLTIFQGYKHAEPLTVFYQIENSTDYNITTLNIPITSPNGECLKNTEMIKFLNPLEFTCSNKLILKSGICESYNVNNTNYIKNGILYAGIDPVYNSLMYSNQNIKFKKIVNRFYTINQTNVNFTSLSNLTKETINNSTYCTCSNIITKIQQDFYVNKTAIVENEVTYFLEDITDLCESLKRIPLSHKISFNGYNKTYNYTKSGNPGYVKGKPIILGQQSSYSKFNNLTGLNDTLPYIKQFKNTPLLFGISISHEDKYKSMCLFSQNVSYIYSESVEKPFYKFDLINNNQNSSYNFFLYKDPFFNFEIKFLDKSSWGCADQFSYADLKKFCLNQDWKKKLIYQNLNNITHLGQFGNADRHLISDWIKIDKLDINSYLSSWDDYYNRCSIPARINLNIFYATYGLVNNTQVAIFKASMNIENLYWWWKNPRDLKTNQEFYTYINVNFYRIPQSMVWWFAPPPGFIKLPRNIMYPFRIGTTVYNKSYFLKNEHYNLLKKFVNVKQIPKNIKNNLSSFFIILFLMGALFF